MVIGIGGVALITAALAERFVACDVASVAEAEEAIDADLAAVRTELRTMAARLHELERALGNRVTRP
jgi:hypothetical protein